MIEPPSGFRFVTNPDLERVAGLMQATWQQPCWLYSAELLGYHLSRPRIDPDLLLGLEDDATGELVAFYSFMPVTAHVGGKVRSAVFGSFLTASESVQGRGAIRAVQVRLLETAIEKRYTLYVAFCEDGAVSNHSIRRSCASQGLTTDTVASVTYHATPGTSRRRQANAHTRPFSIDDEVAALRLVARVRDDEFALRYGPDDYRHRWRSPVGQRFVFEEGGRVRAFLHLAFFDVLDGGQRLTNAYVQDFASGDLSATETADFVGAALLEMESRPCRLVLAPAVGDMTPALLADVGFRKTPRKLNLLVTSLTPSPLDVSDVPRFSLDVF